MTGNKSQVFPNLSLTTWVPQLVQDAIATATSTMLRNLRRQLQTGEIAPSNGND